MNEEPHSSIEPELEVRIVALVLGEASDFERDELNRLIAERPELAAFKSEIQSVHGLLHNVGAGESATADENWKLSTEKRRRVLAAIDGNLDEQPEVKVVLASDELRRSKRKAMVRNLSSIAAVILVAGIIAGTLIPSVQTAREVASRAAPNDVTEPRFENGMGAEVFMSDGAVTMEAAVQEESEYYAGSESEFENDTRSALSDIRDSLGTNTALPGPYYLQDDVQYFPVQPKSRSSQRSTASAESGAQRKSGSSSGEGQDPPPAPAGEMAFPDVAESIASATASKQIWDDSPADRGVYSDDNSDTAANEARSSLWSRLDTVKSPPSSALSDSDAPASGPEESAQNQPQDPFLNGGTRLRYSIEAPKQSDVSGEQRDAEEESVAALPALGKRIGNRASRIGGAVGGEQIDGFGDFAMPEDVTAEPEEALGRQFGGADGGGMGGMGGGGMGMGGGGRPPSSSIPSASNGLEVDGERDYESANTEAGIVANSKTGSMRDQLSTRGELEKLDSDFAIGGDDSGAQNKELREDLRFGRQAPQAITGTQIGQPASPPSVGKPPQSAGWRYRGLSDNPAGAAGANQSADESLPSQYRKGAATFWEELDSKQKSIPGEFTQRGLSAANPQDQEFYYSPQKFSIQGRIESKSRAPVEKAEVPAGLDEKTAAEEAFSTFSLHVSDVSFKLAQAALASGSWPDAAKVRIEEFVNAFDYGDPMPRRSEKVACRVEQSVHPFLQQRNLLRVSMRTAAAGRASTTPLRLTLLVDNSGSMERIDRRQTLRRAFALLAEQLTPIDQVTLISFARQPRLLADKVSGSQSNQLVEIVDNLPSEGGTNIEAALKLAFEKALEHRVENAQNRIILLTDGAVNLGDAEPESLSRMITSMRGAGIAFDAAGISAEGLNDEILEALTRKGDGRYYLLDSLEAADDGFARQIAGALRPSAKNVKVQIEFNPKRVGRYKLLGFEKHRLNKEDFRNDKVDAAEMAAAEAGVAVYQFEAKPNGEGDVGSVSVRFRDLSTGQMVEHCWPIPYEPDAPRLDQAAPSLRVAASAALLAAKLRGEPLGESVDFKALSRLISGLPEVERSKDRVAQLQQMISQARQLSGQ